tara:strand:+ start:732 stop:1028 length:297 start_codon:yes stop_codon:yes gene_type:complete
MNSGDIIKINPDFNDESFLSHGLYKAFILKVVPGKGYCIQSNRWIDADGLYLIVEKKSVINIKNHIYFNSIKVLDPLVGQIVYVNKDHFCEIGDNNEL